MTQLPPLHRVLLVAKADDCTVCYALKVDGLTLVRALVSAGHIINLCEDHLASFDKFRMTALAGA